jgi:phosphoribosylanthranilate isomerase
MAYPTSILIRGINNLSDARYCAGMGADKLSFVLDPSLPGYLEPAVVKELAGWIAGVELMGSLVSCRRRKSMLWLRNVPSTLCCCAACAPPTSWPKLRPRFSSSSAWRSCTWKLTWAALPLPSVVWSWSCPKWISAPTPTRPVQLWPYWASWPSKLPLWLGPGLDPTRARQVLDLLTVSGLVFASGHEIKPGLRDFDQLEALFEALEE